jgi:hypothetical protein
MAKTEMTGDDELQRLIAQIDGEERAAELAHRQALTARLDQLQAAVDKLAKAGKPQLTRQAMSALDKTRYIRRYGVQAYEKIPWS